MPITVADVGGLAVAFHQATTQQIQRELAALDSALFLDPELEPNGPYGPYIYMVVKQHVGTAVPPVPVLEWRDRSGPWPLSMALVEHVKRREGRGDGALQAALLANDRIRARARETTGEQAFEVAQDAKKAAGKQSAVLPRSQSLRRSRDRARARGKKV